MFFTRLPVPRRTRWDERMPDDMAPWFPVVGLLIGAICGLVAWAAGELWPAQSVPTILAIATGLVVTGAFHEDGLADTFDALGGRIERARALEIMKDSRIGTYGATALGVVLLTRWSALLSLFGTRHPVVLLGVVHAASRTGIGAIPVILPYVREFDASKVKPVARRTSAARASIGVVVGVAITAALLRDLRATLTVVGSNVGVTMLCALWFRRRLGGYTGDTLGATQQLCDLATLLTLSAVTWSSF
jgi:adenosylcobinamide-GDP ribazoletransferase